MGLTFTGSWHLAPVGINLTLNKLIILNNIPSYKICS